MSNLKGRPPCELKARAKVFLYGESGTGKTLCATGFPKPYFIDCELGAHLPQYTKGINKSEGVVYRTRDFDDLFEQVRCLAIEKHDYQTIVIDSVTPIYDNLVDSFSKDIGEKFNIHYKKTNQKFRRLIDLLLKVDMNVVITAREKEKYAGEMVIIGTTYAGAKNMHYDFDLTINTKIVNRNHVGLVIKSRIENAKANDEIPFNYEAIKTLFGDELKLGEATPLCLITEDNLHDLKELISKLTISQEVIDKWLKKAQVFDLDELTDAQGQKLIAMLSKQVS